jgi:hypothetical protein
LLILKEFPEKEEVSTSYRWPQLFIEALQALNGKGTRSEIVGWLESHYAEYLGISYFIIKTNHQNLDQLGEEI